MRRGRPDDASPTSTRKDRVTDGEQADRPGAAPVARDGRPEVHREVRADTRASDDARVSFRREASTAPAEPFDPDASFGSHDVARGIRTRAVRAKANPARDGPADQTAPDARSTDGRAHFESAGGNQYSRTSEHGRGSSQRRAPGPFDEFTSSSGDAGSATDVRPGEARRAAPGRPPRSLKARALGYLSRREYSRSELARQLAPYVGVGDEPEALLDSLEREGWLSDARFTESLVHRRASRVGTARILGELKRHAVDDALVESIGARLRKTEFGRAQAVWRKKFGSLPVTPAERAKQARFLAFRGFSSAIIAKLLKLGDDALGDF